MASSKTLLLLLFALFAFVLIVSAEVSTSATDHQTSGVEEDKHGDPAYGGGYEGRGGGGYPGRGYEGRGGGGYPGRGHEGRGGGYPGRGGGGGGYPRRGCQYGCCSGYRYSSGCSRCCSHANEAPDAVFADDVKN